ncbi:MAG: hypothetical protein HS111_10755 [Kofleriaceae bacterium]|nr:hypothetical protein [Kofleriaceae bacterium]
MCKADFFELHLHDAMCAACAATNWAKRNQTADLRGRVALVTGGRVKISAQIALKLLRAGAETLIVTRFPVDAARRLAAEPTPTGCAPAPTSRLRPAAHPVGGPCARRWWPR